MYFILIDYYEYKVHTREGHHLEYDVAIQNVFRENSVDRPEARSLLITENTNVNIAFLVM